MTRPWPAGDAFVGRIGQRTRDLESGLFAIGIEILPWELIGVVIAEDGTRLGASRVELTSMAVEPVVTQIARLATELAAATLARDLSDPRLCLGITLGAPVDPVTGVVYYYANPPHDRGGDDPPFFWIDESLGERIEDATGCVSVIENDAHALAVYEQKLGVGQRTSSFAVLLIRHGIGGAIVIDDRLLAIPAEIGHLMVWPDGRLCDSGLGSHDQARRGRRAIPALVAEKTRLAGDSFEWAVNLANGTGPVAMQAAQAFAEAGTAIARGIAAVLTIFGSPHLIIHGPEELVSVGSGRAADAFMRAACTFPEYTFHHLGMCEITTRSLALDRGAIGAALIASHRHFALTF